MCDHIVSRKTRIYCKSLETLTCWNTDFFFLLRSNKMYSYSTVSNEGGKKTVNNLKKTTTMKGLLFPPAFCDASCCPRWFLNTSFRAWCLRSVQFSDCGKYSECDLFVTEELNMNRTLTQVFIFYLICAEKNMNHFNIFQTSCCCCGKVTRRSSPTWHRGVLLEEKIKFFFGFLSHSSLVISNI